MNISAYILLVFTAEQVLLQKIRSIQSRQQKCGLPRNIAALPDYAQVELRDLWGSYTQGVPCDKELAIQQDVLNVVNTFSREFTEKRITANNSVRRSLVPAATTPVEYDDDPLYSKQSTTSFPTLIGSDSAQTHRKRRPEDQDYDEATIDDIATMQFDNANAPFLGSVPPEVRRKFEKVWNDEDIPSESLRALKEFGWYKKPSSMNIIMHSRSAHPIYMKANVVRNIRRTKDKMGGVAMSSNDDQMERILEENGYSKNIQTLAVSLLTAKQLEDYNRWATKRRYVLKAREQELRQLSSDAKRTLRRMSARDTAKLSVPPAVKRELLNFVAAFNRRRLKAVR
ncbi:hypothetical protein Y032_0773g2236 [Ancylostoma ceylanicum]|nr:hypothetical protein Y032_0773g2236 [Ancylostoma ceylanicum]